MDGTATSGPAGGAAANQRSEAPGSTAFPAPPEAPAPSIAYDEAAMTDAPRPRSTAPLAAALERVGDRWSLLVVEALLEGPARFSDLTGAIPGLAPNILTDRLRRLDREGIVVSRPYSRRPLRLEYSLTADGRDLASALRMLADWGARRSAPDHLPLSHAACGTPLEVRWYCPTCGVVASDRETSGSRLV